jgi:hypothetical protein
LTGKLSNELRDLLARSHLVTSGRELVGERARRGRAAFRVGSESASHHLDQQIRDVLVTAQIAGEAG